MFKNIKKIGHILRTTGIFRFSGILLTPGGGYIKF